jgi:hypothetical protein
MFLIAGGSAGLFCSLPYAIILTISFCDKSNVMKSQLILFDAGLFCSFPYAIILTISPCDKSHATKGRVVFFDAVFKQNKKLDIRAEATQRER